MGHTLYLPKSTSSEGFCALRSHVRPRIMRKHWHSSRDLIERPRRRASTSRAVLFSLGPLRSVSTGEAGSPYVFSHLRAGVGWPFDGNGVPFGRDNSTCVGRPAGVLSRESGSVTRGGYKACPRDPFALATARVRHDRDRGGTSGRFRQALPGCSYELRGDWWRLGAMMLLPGVGAGVRVNGIGAVLVGSSFGRNVLFLFQIAS